MNSLRRALLLGAIALPLRAGPVIPDPSDSLLISVPVDRVTVPLAHVSGLAAWSALSGDGATAVLGYNQVVESIGLPLPPKQPVRIVDELVVRNGVRSALTHWDTQDLLSSNSPTESGPRWTTVGLPYDGSFAVSTRSSGTNSQAVILTLPDKVETALPLTRVLKVSPDGRCFIGFDSTGNLVRYRRTDRRVDIIIPSPGPSSTQTQGVYGISDDGETIYGSGNTTGGYLWSPDQGVRPVSTLVGRNVSMSSLDGSGRMLVGRKFTDNGDRPVYWTESEGQVLLTNTLNGLVNLSGSAELVSGDGSMIFGWLSISGAQVSVVWTRDGAIYSLESLIRGVDTHGIIWSGVPTAASRDGRTIVGRGLSPTEGAISYVARIGFPGEGPRLRLKASASTAPAWSFRAKTGFRYQVQQATIPDTWRPIGSEIVGDDADHETPLPAPSGAPGFFRVVVQP